MTDRTAINLFVSMFTGGGDAVRNAIQLRDAGGWRAFVDREIRPAVAWAEAAGLRPIIWPWNPFGILLDGEAMQADQYVDAQEQGLGWLADAEQYVEAWRGIESIAHVGKPSNAPEIAAYLKAGDHSKVDWLLWRSYRPIKDAGQGVSLDALSSSPAGGLDEAVTRAMLAEGRRVICELTPPASLWQAELRLPSVILYERLDQHHGPGQQPPQIAPHKPAWDTDEWRDYAAPGIHVICKHPAIKIGDMRSLVAAAARVRSVGCIPLVQLQPAIYRVDPWEFRDSETVST